MKQTIYALIILTFFSCRPTENKNNNFQSKERAKELNDQGAQLITTFNNDSIKKALILLEEATTIQPDYYLAHWNKFVCQSQLELREAAFETLKRLEELKPENPDLKVLVGVFMELNNDSLAARQKFLQAEHIYASIIDTMSLNSNQHQYTSINKALDLRMLGSDKDANQIFEDLKTKSENDQMKQLITVFQAMTRKEVINFYQNQYKDKSPTR